MSKVLLGIAIVFTSGLLMAGTPLSSRALEGLPHLTIRLVADDHGGSGGGSGHSSEGGGSSRGGSSDHAGRSAEAGDDNGGNGEMEAGDDHGVDVNDQPDDSDAALIPLAAN